MERLSDTKIRTAKAKAVPYILSDGHGLRLLVKPSGTKLWQWKYSILGRERIMSFGQYPAVVLASAREAHLAARQILASGTDPMEARKVAKLESANSFYAVAQLWLSHWSAGTTKQHSDSTRRRLEQNVFPAIGDKPVAEIEAPDVVEMARAIEARGVPDLAKRSLQTTGQIFRYAVAHGHAKHNPVAEFKPGDVLKSTRKVNLARVDAKELPTLLRAIEVYRGSQVTRLAMKLIAMTFVRTGELIGARWSEFEFEERRWNIPADRMKMKTPHIVPLATQAVETLELLKTITGNGELLFPGERDQHKPMSNNTILGALKRMGYKGRMTGHGFRGLASTILHEKGYQHEHIELQLAHAPRNAVSAAYNHALYLEPRAKMMQDWADYLEQAQRGAKVLQMQATG